MNPILFIPARAGSKSIPDKNVKKLGGKPLIFWTIDFVCKKCKIQPVLSSDSVEYLQMANERGAYTLKRPVYLAKDNSSMLAVLKHDLARLKITDPDQIIVLLQPTAPFRKLDEFKSMLKVFEDSNNDSIISVNRVPEKYHPEEVIVETCRGYEMGTRRKIRRRITRRQLYPKAYHPNGNYYMFRYGNILNGSMYGDHVGIFETTEGININSPEDWKSAERIAKSWKF